MYYILDNDKKIVKATDKEYTEFFKNPDARRVALDEINGSRISTVFLGLDHRFDEKGPPILFETMVFGGPLDQEQERCCTWDDAEMMHTMMVERVRNA
jgi:hypothetical protein